MRAIFTKVILLVTFFYSIFIVYKQFFFFGLSYDESLFINAAVKKDSVTFISKQLYGIPIMVMQYIGALKSWLYYPIFQIFGVNILSIRLPMVLLMYVNFYLMYVIGIKYFNKTVVLCVIIILFTDYTFINLHKIDHGPSALETFLKLLCLYFISKKESRRNSLIIFSILILGVFNKLNFIWFVNGLFGTYIIFSFLNKIETNPLKLDFKKLISKAFLLNVVLYFAIVLFFVFILKLQKITPNNPSDVSEFIQQIFLQFHYLLITILNLRYDYLVGWVYSNAIDSVIYLKFILIIVAIFNIILLLKNKLKPHSTHFQLITLTILISVQYVYTKEATNMWHILMIYPFFHLIIFNSLFIGFQYFSFNPKIIVFSLLSIWAGYNIFNFYNFQKKISINCYFWLYDPTINQLIDYTQGRPEKNVISSGYGIHSQLLVMDKKGKSYIELIDNTDNSTFIDVLDYNSKFLNDYNNTIVVVNNRAVLISKKDNPNKLIKSLDIKGFKLSLVKVIKDGCGVDIFNIYKVARK